MKAPIEKLGSFYLGAKYDLENHSIGEETVNYDARDLCTHAVCVGMTGSGKTGLCVGLLEEAALDKIPAIIIDPKGDMTNLLLQFEDLSPASFRKWINEDDANRKGMTPDDFAKATAEKWKNGLAEWGQGPERIKALKDSVEYTVYTPGSDSGVPINIMGSFAAPKMDFEENAEILRERIQGTVAALMGMIGSKEDPVRSREGILLANIFEHYWKENQDLDLAKLIHGIQDPPIKKLGVFDVETFYPSKDRFQLAMDFNTLVASPQFQYWLKGDPLDIDKIYFTADGKPRHSIFYIAHLSDSERMFFVTLLLNSLLTWMRRQSGTTSLKSLLYFDEIFGYFPPTANPPSKKPLLTLLKQARAFGLGSVLVTQNPVDIDYKGLSNAGTWFIGKLQTERDKERVLDGLKGAIAEAGNSTDTNFSEIISALDSRTFLLHNVHDSAPVVYHTRWAMSYLRGPLTRPQVKQLMESKKAERAAAPATAKESGSIMPAANATPPSIDSKIKQKFFGVWKTQSQARAELHSTEDLSLVFQAKILAIGKVLFNELDEISEKAMLAGAPDEFGRCNWTEAENVTDWERSLLESADVPQGVAVQYEDLPDSLDTSKEFTSIEKDFSDHLYQSEKREKYEHKKLKLKQEEDESAEAFQMRATHAAREIRDKEVDKMEDKFDTKLERIKEKIRKEEEDLNQAEQDVRDRKRAATVGIAETAFGMLFGRKRSFSGAQTKMRMKRKAEDKVRESEDDLVALQDSYEDLQKEMQEAIDEITDKWDDIADDVTTKEIKPRRSDVKVNGVILTWNPVWVDKAGNKTSARG